jgi:hypothetical protein
MNATGDPGSQPPSQRPRPSPLDALARVPDPRHARGRRHPWLALLVLLVVALLCGANSQRGCARWIQDAHEAHRRRLGFTRSDGPSRATVNRLLHQVDVLALEGALSRWAQQVRATGAGGAPPTGPGGVAAAHWVDGIAVDGKTLRGARRLGVAAAHLVSACCQQHGLVLGQVSAHRHFCWAGGAVGWWVQGQTCSWRKPVARCLPNCCFPASPDCGLTPCGGRARRCMSRR